VKAKKQRWFWMSVSLIAISALLYCSWPLGFWLNPQATRSGLASELGAFGQPYHWLFIWGDVVSGALLLVGCGILLRTLRAKGWARLCLVLLALYGICGALDAALPLQCVPSLQVCGPVLHDPLLILHGVFDFGGSFSLIGTLYAGWRFAKNTAPEWLPWIYVIGIGGTIFAAASGVLYIANGPGYWAQRYYITLSCIWVATIPFVLARKKRYAVKA
jgi:hypothetical protein